MLRFEPEDIVRGTEPRVQITRRGVDRHGSDADIDALADLFERQHAVHLPRFVAPDLWTLTQRCLAEAHFETKIHGDLIPPAVNLTIVEPTLLSCYMIAINDPTITTLIQRITRSDPIGAWIGDFYRMEPGQEHHDSWHDDIDGNRLAAITINVSRDGFEGGELSMRRKDTRQVLWTFKNSVPGDAVLFRLDDRLQHWIHDVSGTHPKMAVAGWFQRTPSFWSDLREQHARESSRPPVLPASR